MARSMERLARLGLAWAVVCWAAAARAAEALPGQGGEQYQGKSVEKFGRGSAGLWSAFLQVLDDLDITRAKVLIIVGVVGALFTLSKNKRLFHWGVVAAISYALIALGALAIYKGWPSMN